jgi:hypothetical protein
VLPCACFWPRFPFFPGALAAPSFSFFAPSFASLPPRAGGRDRLEPPPPLRAAPALTDWVASLDASSSSSSSLDEEASCAAPRLRLHDAGGGASSLSEPRSISASACANCACQPRARQTEAGRRRARASLPAIHGSRSSSTWLRWAGGAAMASHASSAVPNEAGSAAPCERRWVRDPVHRCRQARQLPWRAEWRGPLKTAARAGGTCGRGEPAPARAQRVVRRVRKAGAHLVAIAQVIRHFPAGRCVRRLKTLDHALQRGLAHAAALRHVCDAERRPAPAAAGAQLAATGIQNGAPQRRTLRPSA